VTLTGATFEFENVFGFWGLRSLYLLTLRPTFLLIMRLSKLENVLTSGFGRSILIAVVSVPFPPSPLHQLQVCNSCIYNFDQFIPQCVVLSHYGIGIEIGLVPQPLPLSEPFCLC